MNNGHSGYNNKTFAEHLKLQYENFKNVKNLKRMPSQTEVLIIGGGIVGAFVAYWIKLLSQNINVSVIEKDQTYSKSSTFWSVGGHRQQFSLPENIKMSLFSINFIQQAHQYLKCEEEHKVDLDYHHDGYLFLASKDSKKMLYDNHRIQLAHKAKVKLLNIEELKNKFKWLSTDEVEFGSFGYLNEGWVDSRKYLLAVRNKAAYLGAEFFDGEIVEFSSKVSNQEDFIIEGPIKQLKNATIETQDGKKHQIRFSKVVNCAGPWAANIARMAGIGSAGLNAKVTPLIVSLPVEARKRYIYMFYAENGPILNVPLTIDYSGVFFRRNGLSNYYISGLNQNETNEPQNLDLDDIDKSYFEQKIKPVLLKRVPSFKNLKLVNSWSGYYEYNTFDQNLIIGPHPVLSNFIFANGSSGHGLQHAAAIGKAVSELIVYGEYKTLDLKRFGFERVLRDSPLKEIDVV